ncbi:hypothetical protein Q9L58_005860 [Maublancomyces gigas]|uniref:Uncharacterized protein n=1 Tax=Discina gigas TaxID=1032678 RepID=A0ABR3GGZ2_9PEZI
MPSPVSQNNHVTLMGCLKTTRNINTPCTSFQIPNSLSFHITLAQLKKLSSFFEQYPDFSYDATNSKQSEFDRLQEHKGWDPSSMDFRAQYKAFRLALVKEVGAPIDEYFLAHRLSGYQNKRSPWIEFERLMREQGVTVNYIKYKQEKARFTALFKEAFSRDIDVFFAKYSGFDYNPREESKAEFERLRRYKKWHIPYQVMSRPDQAEYDQARGEFFEAFIVDFTYFFGVGDHMRDWECLCDVMRISPLPLTMDGCKVALESYYVNIFDLYDHVQRGTPLKFHAGEKELAVYSHAKSLVFPRSLAKSTCMKVLLRRLDDPEITLAPTPTSGDWNGVITIDRRRRRRASKEE